MIDLARYLGRWLALPPEAAAQMAPYVSACHYARGQCLFRFGDRADDIIFLTQGLVRVFQLQGSREINLRLLAAPAAALPYHSFLVAQPADEALEAVTEVVGFRVRFRALCDDHPGPVVADLRRVLAERHFLAMQRRVRMLQAGRSDHRYRVFLEEMEPEVIRLTPARHVASYLGITPESLSRIRLRRRRGGADA